MLCYIAESNSAVPGSGQQAQRHYSDLSETSVCPPKPNGLAVESMSITTSPKGIHILCVYVVLMCKPLACC